LKKGRPLIEIKIPYAKKLYGHKIHAQLMKSIEERLTKALRRTIYTEGGGRWPKAKGRLGRLRRPLGGIRKHVGFEQSGNDLKVVALNTGKRGKFPTAWAHQQRPGSRGIKIKPKQARAMYIPLTRKANRITVREAMERSSRFGGDLKEGVLIDGVFYYYDASKPKGTKGRLKKGWPDFFWCRKVHLPKRALFDRRTTRTVIREAVYSVLLPAKIAKSKIKLRMKIN
jgi:hypothetical protein